MRPSVVNAYLELIEKFHPELQPQASESPTP